MCEIETDIVLTYLFFIIIIIIMEDNSWPDWRAVGIPSQAWWQRAGRAFTSGLKTEPFLRSQGPRQGAEAIKLGLYHWAIHHPWDIKRRGDDKWSRPWSRPSRHPPCPNFLNGQQNGHIPAGTFCNVIVFMIIVHYQRWAAGFCTALRSGRP
jgi:hypothetical protein